MTITTRGEAIAKLRLSMSAPDLERLKTMERLKGRYITTSWDAQLLRSINQLIATVGTCKVLAGEATEYSRETRALVVIGEAGTGKTESLNRIFQTHPALTGYGTPGSGCPLRSVSVPAPCTSKALGNAILRAVDYPVARELKEHVLWALVQEKLADAGVLLLHLDEMHNLTSNANITQIDNIRKTLKSLMVSPQWPIGLIISGLPELAPEMQAIDELRRRGRFLRRPLLVAPGDVDLVRGIVEGCAEIATVVIAQDSTTDIAHRLLQASLGRFGMMIEIAHEAIEQCLVEGRPLSLEHFATAYFDRTGCSSKMNPFLAPNWHEIDCALVFASEFPFESAMLSAHLRPSRLQRTKGGAK